jgi:hypothetical protein
MPTCYWSLKNKDPGIQKFAKDRVESIMKSFEKLVEKYSNASYQDTRTLDQPLWTKSDQRIDFMINVYYEMIKQCSSKLSELENERERRLL